MDRWQRVDPPLAAYSSRDAELTMRLWRAWAEIDREESARRRRAVIAVLLVVYYALVLIGLDDLAFVGAVFPLFFE
jgi:hypothetical protein